LYSRETCDMPMNNCRAANTVRNEAIWKETKR
jgi:hypothetical protein